jgi:hypothetical protein
VKGDKPVIATGIQGVAIERSWAFSKRVEGEAKGGEGAVTWVAINHYSRLSEIRCFTVRSMAIIPGENDRMQESLMQSRAKDGR